MMHQNNTDLHFSNTEELLQTILDDSNQMIQVSELDTLHMLYANQTARAYTGHGDQPYQGVPCYKYMMGMERQCPFCPLLKMDEDGLEETEVDNGNQIYAVKTKVLELDGKKVFIEYAWDITEIRRSMRIFENQVNMLMKSIPQAQGIMHMDLTEDVCLTTAGAAENMKGFRQNVSVDETIAQMVSFVPTSPERKELFEAFCRNSLLKAYKNGEIQLNQVTRSYFDDGSVRYARISARFFMNPANGHLECVVYGMDISDEMNERKKHEDDMREQLSIFNVLAKNFLNVFLVDVKENSVRVLKLDGYVTSGLVKDDSITYRYYDVCRQYVKERVHPEDQEMMYEALKTETVMAALEQKDSYVGSYRVLINGESHTYQFHYEKMEDSNQIIAGFQNIDEIIHAEKERQQTLAIALEAARQSSRAKTEFLNNMSHDIRTPMNAIIGFTSLAMKNFDDKEKVWDYLSKIDTSGKHLLSLINDVLDMSRIESGRVRINEKEVYLPDILEDIRAILQPESAARKIDIRVETVHVVNEYIFCDRLRVNQILLNLLSNALKFTNPGGKIRVLVIQKQKAFNGYAAFEFKVCDTGIGMSREFQNHIFEAFSRESSATVSGIEGTGLGLAITRSLVDMMGGTIQVQSQEGVGSEFSVNLQFRIGGAHPEKQDKESMDGVHPAERRDFSGMKILLVEDNPLNQEIAREILTDAGFEVETADDGDVAVSRLRFMKEGDFDLVLMDIQMPRMDGYTATREIRTLPNHAAANIPILAVTANAFREDKNAAVRAGMNGHIAKPLDVQQLFSVMAEILS